jgi:hypothetical protein
MANSAYFSGNGSDDHFANGRSLSLNFDNPSFIELQAFQQHTGQQHLSPTMPQRHDSMFQCSPMVLPRPSSSQHQAESQPYANVYGGQHSPNAYAHLPVNTNMSRSTSQISHTSSGQQQRNRSLHRASRDSFGSNPPTGASDMSRSYSNASAGFSTAASERCPVSHYSATQPDNHKLAKPRPRTNCEKHDRHV